MHKATWLLPFVVVVSGCSGGGGSQGATPPAAQPGNVVSSNARVVEDVDIDKHIDGKLPPHDRQVMHRIMKMLRKQDRFNVMYFDSDGHAYSNKASLLAGMARAYSLPKQPNVFVDAAGHRTYGPPTTVRPTSFDGSDQSPVGHRRASGSERQPMYTVPPNNKNSGPYRRVWSAPGFAYEAFTVSLPCNAGSISVTNVNSGNPSDVGYLYLGGWGVTGASAVDAGFQHSSSFDGSTPGENYALFVKEAFNPDGQVGGTADNNNYDTYNSRFTCGQDVNVTYYIPDPGYFAAVASGQLVGGATDEVTAIDGFRNAQATNDWPQNGGGSNGIVLKRMTSIGQSDPNTGATADELTDGSAFMINPNDNNPQPFGHWHNGTLARHSDGSDAVQWNGAVNGGAYDYPCKAASGFGSGVVFATTISGVSYATEDYEGIYADPNNPCNV